MTGNKVIRVFSKNSFTVLFRAPFQFKERLSPELRGVLRLCRTTQQIYFSLFQTQLCRREITDVCVSVYKYGKLYTAIRAVDFGCEYQSIIVYGTIRILTSAEERIAAMQLFFQKFFSGVAKDFYEGFDVRDAHPIHVARKNIDDWFGKGHLVPPVAISSFYPSPDPVVAQFPTYIS